MEGKAYKEILKVLNKHKDIIVFDVEDLERQAKYHLFGIELKEKHGFDIDPCIINALDWNRLGEYLDVSMWGNEKRHIGWSDDDSQPNNELLLRISFPTGAYIFGGDYPTDFFKQFFSELKTYNPKYTDSRNKSLYFSMDNAGKMFNDFAGIYKKYRELNAEDFKKRKIIKLKKELENLQD